MKTIVVTFVNHHFLQNISPGSVRTEIYYDVLWKSAPHLKNSSLADCEFLSVDDVVKACIFILDTPPNVLVMKKLKFTKLKYR